MCKKVDFSLCIGVSVTFRLSPFHETLILQLFLGEVLWKFSWIIRKSYCASHHPPSKFYWVQCENGGHFSKLDYPPNASSYTKYHDHMEREATENDSKWIKLLKYIQKVQICTAMLSNARHTQWCVAVNAQHSHHCIDQHYWLCSKLSLYRQRRNEQHVHFCYSKK